MNYSFILLSIMILYLILLNEKTIEGNSMDNAKREVKYLEMANIDRLLNRLIGVFSNMDQDCEGGYTEYGACDKKCGKTYKYKTYRVNKRAGIKGSGCIKEDGFRNRKICDKSDGIFPCGVGEPCVNGEDCESGNCDPKTNTCTTVEVCAEDNLKLCTKGECKDLNNQYDYTDKHFVYDVGSLICKLKSDSNNNNNNDIFNEEDDGTISIPQGIPCPWYSEEDNENDTLTHHGCKLKNASLVYLEEGSRDLLIRGKQYGEVNMESGLYCREFGKTYDGSNIGFTEPIPEIKKEELNVKSDVCGNYMGGNIEENGSCEEGYWADIEFFKNNNEKQTKPLNINTDLCTRCNNGYKYSNGICNKSTSDKPCDYNQYMIDSNGQYVNNPTYDNQGEIGKNTGCETGKYGENIPLSCPGGYEWNEVNCEPCPKGKYSKEGEKCIECDPGTYARDIGSTVCSGCPAGTSASGTGNEKCIECDSGTYASGTGNEICSECGSGTYASGTGNEKCIECDSGTYASGTGNEICSECGSGTYASGTGSTECSECDSGTYASGTGNEICSACDPGTYASNIGSTECSECELGKFASETGSTECNACDPGTYASNIGSTECITCPAPKIVKSGKSCEECPEGSHFQDNKCLSNSDPSEDQGVGQPSPPSCTATNFDLPWGHICGKITDETNPAYYNNKGGKGCYKACCTVQQKWCEDSWLPGSDADCVKNRGCENWYHDDGYRS
jgi:hypothetical protein